MDRATKIWMGVALLLFIIIIAMATMLFTLPGKAEAPVVATTTPQQPSPQPEPVPPVQSIKPAVVSPQPNTEVSSTFTVKGKAPGTWFFEATFPMQVRDKDNSVIGHGHANAQGDWQTSGIVGFEGIVNLDVQYTGDAVLVLMKDNPSGLPENDDAIEIPIYIK